MNRKRHPDTGACFHRTETDALEHSLAYGWMEINQWKAGINHGRSMLECILAENNNDFPRVTSRDRHVAASVIQWLGTNCGYSFLCSQFLKAGYYIAGKGPVKPWPGSGPDAEFLALVDAIIQTEQHAKDAAQMLFDLSEPT